MTIPAKSNPLLCTLLTAAAAALPASAAAGDFHGAPYDDLMGNHIDTHLETRIRTDGDGNPVSLTGRFYIIPIDEDGDGKPDIDEDSGLEKWRHPRGAGQHDEDCDFIECRVGWQIRGWPASAVFLSHDGVNGNDHPQWLLPRDAIPQPGAPSHFHWITYVTDANGDPVAGTTTDPRGPDQPAACNEQKAGQLEGDVLNEADLTATGPGQAEWSNQDVHVALEEGGFNYEAGAEGVVCYGWIFELKPVGKAFAFQHSGEVFPVYSAGFDVRTHLNMQANYALVPGIEGGSGGHGDGGDMGGGGGHGGGMEGGGGGH